MTLDLSDRSGAPQGPSMLKMHVRSDDAVQCAA